MNNALKNLINTLENITPTPKTPPPPLTLDNILDPNTKIPTRLTTQLPNPDQRSLRLCIPKNTPDYLRDLPTDTP